MTTANDTDTVDPAQRLRELADKARFAMVTTIDADGHLVSRPMAPQQIEPDASIWFIAQRGSRLVAHLGANDHVGVTLCTNDSWVSVDGSAVVVDDDAKARELWNTFAEAWLPEGPESAEVALVKVTPHTGEYWDSPGGVLSSAISLIKTKITGERYEGGENRTVDL